MKCSACGTDLQIGQWPFCRGNSADHGSPHGNLSPLGVHESEAIMVWQNPATGEVRYPDRNDRPMPERYRQQGFERRTLKTLREADSFCGSHRLVNHKLHYDGSGRSYDGA